MIDIKQEHIDNEYYIKLSNNKERNICVVEIPQNIFLKIDKTTLIYELENGKVNVYKDKEKLFTKNCPNYTKRVLIWSHLARLLGDRDAVDVPVVTDDCGTILDDCDSLYEINPILKILDEPETYKDVELETRLIESISKYNSAGFEPPQDVLDGFLACVEIFKGD